MASCGNDPRCPMISVGIIENQCTATTVFSSAEGWNFKAEFRFMNEA